MSDKTSIVITSASRTAVGSLGGGLKNILGHELGASVIASVAKKSKLKKK